MIPNIVHFNYGLSEQDDDFLFVYYIAVLSCYIINKPNKIYFHYHYEPKGVWWEKTKELVDMIKVEIPKYIGKKEIKKTAHKSDILRLNILKEYGGIYLDIDTICSRPYKDLLYNKFVIANEINASGGNMGLCNAIMMSEPNSSFINQWLSLYEECFHPDGWGEASIKLPQLLSQVNKELTILPNSSFLYPGWMEIHLIFETPSDINPDLITLHYWNQYSHDRYLTSICGFDWLINNSHTLYGKLLLNILNKMSGINDINIIDTTMKHIRYHNFMKSINYNSYNSINNITYTNNEDVYQHFNMAKDYNLIISPIFSNTDNIVKLKAYKVYMIDLNFEEDIKLYSTSKDFNYFVRKNNGYCKVSINNTTNNHHIQVKQTSCDIIYNMKNTSVFYIFPKNIIMNKPVKMNIKPIISIKDAIFGFTTHAVSKKEIMISIKRFDTDLGWHRNLYLDITINNNNYYYYIGKSSISILKFIINCDTYDTYDMKIKQKIPKTLIYYSNNEIDIDIISSIKEMNSDYRCHFITLKNARDYIKYNYDSRVLDMYDRVMINEIKIELFKLCILNKIGGVFINSNTLSSMVPMRNIINPDDTNMDIDNIYASVSKVFDTNIMTMVDRIENLYYPKEPYVKLDKDSLKNYMLGQCYDITKYFTCVDTPYERKTISNINKPTYILYDISNTIIVDNIHNMNDISSYDQILIEINNLFTFDKYNIEDKKNIILNIMKTHNLVYKSKFEELYIFTFIKKTVIYEPKEIIPKTTKYIYTTWHTKDLPPLMKKCWESVQQNNPEFECCLYDEEDCCNFIKENFDKSILDAYKSLVPKSYKSDLWRFCVLYKMGGIYIDIKFHCTNNFKFINFIDKDYWCRDIKESMGGMCTGFIIANKGNQVFMDCINNIIDNIKNDYYGDTPLHPTGPMLLNKFFTQEDKDSFDLELFVDYKVNTMVHIKYKDNIILSQYYEYRDEQKLNNNGYYVDLWKNKNIYIKNHSNDTLEYQNH